MADWRKQKHCLNCEAELNGPFCHKCGEKVLSDKDRTLLAVLGEFMSSLWNFDNKFYRSLKLLLFKPGELSRLYILGVRQRYLRPVRFFLIANLLYFLFPIFSSLNTAFKTQMNGLVYSDWVRPNIEAFIEKKEVEYEVFEREFNRKSSSIAKLIVIVLAPIFGFMFWMLHLRFRTFYAADFVVLAMYFLTFYILVFLLVFPSIFVRVVHLLGYEMNHFIGERVYGNIMFIGNGIFLAVAFRRIFKQKWWVVILKALVVIILFVPALFLYRFILLNCTLALMGYFG